MNPLLKSTQKGHKRIIQIRMRIAASWAIVVSILIAVADFMNLQMSGLVISYQVAIQSFPALRTNSSSWSISQLFLFEFVLTALSSIVATWIILALVQLLENYWSAMILSFSVLALPIIYIFVFAESIAYLPAFSLSLNLRFLSIVGLRSHQIISIVLILITLILYYLNV